MMNFLRQATYIAFIALSVLATGCASFNRADVNIGENGAPPPPDAKPLPAAQSQILASSAKTGGLDGATGVQFLRRWRDLNPDGTLGDWYQIEDFVALPNFERELTLGLVAPLAITRMQHLTAVKVVKEGKCPDGVAACNGNAIYVEGAQASSASEAGSISEAKNDSSTIIGGVSRRGSKKNPEPPKGP